MFATAGRSGARTRRLPLLALCLAVSTLLAPCCLAGFKTQRDPVHKFSLKVFADWKEVPTEAGDEIEVMKFYEPVSRGDYPSPELRVVRVVKDGAQAPVTGPGGIDLSQIPEEFRDQFRVKSAWDATMGRLSQMGLEAPDPEKVEHQDITTAREKVRGRLWIHTASLGATLGLDAVLYATLAVFEKDGVEYGIFLTCSERRGKKFAPDFKSIARSFTFFDEHAQEVEELDVLKDVSISPKRKAAIEASIVKGWAVIVSPKRNYIVIYNTKNNKNHLLAKEIAERIECLRQQVYEVQFPPLQPVEAVSIVRVCGDRTDYHSYGGPMGSAGYWNSGTEELVFYDASPAKKPDDDTLAVLYHEAFHQYIYYGVGNVAPHSWFNEGHGDYYSGAKYQRGKFQIGTFRWRIGVVKAAMREGPRPCRIEVDAATQAERKVWEAKGYTPLKDLITFSQQEYYSYPSVSYAQGWSLVYFLREIVPKNKEWNRKWGHILDAYFDTLKAEVGKSGELIPGGRGDEGEGEGGEGGGADGGGEEPRPEEPAEPVEPAGPAEPAGPTEPGDGGETGGAPGGEQEGGEEGEGEDGEGEEGGEDGGAGEGVSDIPPPPPDYISPQEALQKALEEAFKGVDIAELEKAWIESILKVAG